MTTFFLPMLPPTSTHQQVGHTIDKQGRHRFYQRGNGEAEAKLTAHLMKHIPEQPYSGAIRVVVKWCYPRKAKHQSGEPYTNKPDVDNLCKALFDIMTRLHDWNDDKQIYSAVVEKFWADVPGVFVEIEEAEVQAIEHELCTPYYAALSLHRVDLPALCRSMREEAGLPEQEESE